MSYADYGFYTSEYFGNVIPDSNSFARAAARATAYIDAITFGRVTSPADERVKKAECAVADLFYRRELSDAATQNGAITGQSAGSYSVNYAAQTDAQSAFSRGLRSAAELYLCNTDLLYRGGM